ncbi:hypothetical protein FDF35_11580 [Acinetobacter baumannii]|nr:hypothetical protein FDF35_11580 [Acinetobacter baumannii]
MNSSGNRMFLRITIKSHEWMQTGTTGVIPTQNLKSPDRMSGLFSFNPLFQWYLHQRQVVSLEFVQECVHAFLECVR